ncbi:MAG TPA: hypothetical protein VME41_08330 [Stellaceae bacterium]|nr:hypothetical protein [Stellaceae bacterium]
MHRLARIGTDEQQRMPPGMAILFNLVLALLAWTTLAFIAKGIWRLLG